ncbi:MAG: hypothetical protein AB1489_24570, partial [Acidobacteriota bacterium]
TVLKAIGLRLKQIELHGRLTGAFQKDRENESDAARKRARYEHAVTRIIERAAQQGFPLTRQQAIDGLAAYPEHADIYRYLNGSDCTEDIESGGDPS